MPKTPRIYPITPGNITNMQTGALTSKNLSSVIKSLRTKVGKISPQNLVLYVPKRISVLSKRYRGTGRPRKSDYDQKLFARTLFTKSKIDSLILKSIHA